MKLFVIVSSKSVTITPIEKRPKKISVAHVRWLPIKVGCAR